MYTGAEIMVLGFRVLYQQELDYQLPTSQRIKPLAGFWQSATAVLKVAVIVKQNAEVQTLRLLIFHLAVPG
jgi:hypothetical protein